MSHFSHRIHVGHTQNQLFALVFCFLSLHFIIFQSLMYNEGDITRPGDLVDPTTGRFSQLVRKVTSLISRPATPDIAAEESVILTAMLKVV